MAIEALRDNLKVVDGHGSAAENHVSPLVDICHRLKSYRLQFSSYLKGRTTPAWHVFKSIYDFRSILEACHADHSEALRPHAASHNVVSLKPMDVTSDVGPGRYVAYLDQLARRSRKTLREYDGYYFEYSRSMTLPDVIHRSLIKISGEGDVTTYTRIENMARVDAPQRRITCKHRGMIFYLNGRVFLMDTDSPTGNELTQTVMYPKYQNRLSRLSGIKLGNSPGLWRCPPCTRVLWQDLGRQFSLTSALRACGLYDADSPEIAPEIKTAIDSSP